MDLSLTTELDAVNTMLSTIGESPVNTIVDSGVVDAVMALQILSTVSRGVQVKGWHFNTEKDFVLTPSYLDGYLVLPPTVLSVDTVGADASTDVVVRGTRLYDRRNHTYTFTRTYTVDMVILLPFEELPEPARQYITIRAARIFQERTVGAQELSGFAKNDEAVAWASLKATEAETADLNIFDNYAVTSILDR